MSAEKLTKNRTELLKTLGLDSSFSLLSYYPYRYDILKLSELSFKLHNNKVTVEGIIINPLKISYLPNKKTKISFEIKYNNIIVRVVMFNRTMYARLLKVGVLVVISGKYNAITNEISAAYISTTSLNNKTRIIPHYTLPLSTKDSAFRKFMESAYLNNEKKIVDIIPQEFINKYHLVSKKEAIKYIHFPENEEDLKQASRYLKYEELLNFCLTGGLKRHFMASCKHRKVMNQEYIYNFIKSLPYKLSDDQNSVIKEILHDMASLNSMSRLLQGDVGSGKTIVSFIALLANYSASYQGALMVPSEILASQHYENAIKIINNFDPNIKIALLTSSSDTKTIHEGLKDGSIDIVIGTHSLISTDVFFKNLGLAVIDEQHRFGVKQRISLKEKGNNIDVLYMSATPIPRTLASTLYLDMDVSTIENTPFKNKNIKTHFINSLNIKSIVPTMKKYLSLGKKIFVVVPTIEGNNEKMTNISKTYKLISSYFNEDEVYMVHGKMKDDLKNEMISAFSKGKGKILIATTVIEVGIDIQDSDMILIYNAERFGLATLHQLRGRIARSGGEGICYLLSDSDDEMAIERLNYFASTLSGFDISTYDLKTRGEGDILGILQSGKSPLMIASIINDYKILKCASVDANQILHNMSAYKDYINNLLEAIDFKSNFVE